jgi:hypothetical protein
MRLRMFFGSRLLCHDRSDEDVYQSISTRAKKNQIYVFIHAPMVLSLFRGSVGVFGKLFTG